MNSNPWPLARVVITVFFLSLAGIAPASADAVSGAIYTSTVDGSTVNANLYDAKEDVYLNGGPPLNAPCTAGGIDDDDYYFQVTSPDGGTLLSSDSVFERKFRVIGGVISQYLGATHGIGSGNCTGAISIRLIPYDDTPNNGDVYKVWITRVSDYHANCPTTGNNRRLRILDCGMAGFVEGHTKTDNFRVRDTGGNGNGYGNLEVFKYYDNNGNGAYDAGELPLADWPMTISPSGSPATQLTSQTGLAIWTNLSQGTYTVQEGEPTEPSRWYNSDPGPNPTELDGNLVDTPVAISAWVARGSYVQIDFGNFCLASSGGHTKGFWHNNNGYDAMNDGGTIETELALLRAKPLWDAAGNPFDPTTFDALSAWLTNESNAQNMANMLSAQYAAMLLNVEAGFVDPNDFYAGSGGTIGELLVDAEAALAADGYTPSGDPNRALQAELKTWLDQLNNGADVIPAVPCAYSF